MSAPPRLEPEAVSEGELEPGAAAPVSRSRDGEVQPQEASVGRAAGVEPESDAHVRVDLAEAVRPGRLPSVAEVREDRRTDVEEMEQLLPRPEAVLDVDKKPPVAVEDPRVESPQAF